MVLMNIGALMTFLAIQCAIDVLYNEYKEYYVPCGITALLMTFSGIGFYVVGGLHG